MALATLSPGSVRALREFTVRRKATQPELQRRLGASAPTVSRAVAQLRDLGVIRTDGDVERGQGRPAAQLELPADGFGLMVLIIQADSSVLHIVDARGDIRESSPIDVTAADPYESAIDAYVAAVRDLMPTVRAQFRLLVGLGIVFAGSVDAAQGMLTTPSRFPGWHNRAITHDLGSQLGLPCSIENDATSMVSALLWFRRERLPKNFALLVADLGLGAGFSFGGAVYAGDNHVPPGIAHTTAFAPSDERCHCGRTGCLETVLSIPAVLRQAEEAGWLTDVGRDREAFLRLVEAARQREELNDLLADAGATAARVADTLGRALNLSAVVFAGDLIQLSSSAWESVDMALTAERTAGSALSSWWRIDEVLPAAHVGAVGGAGVVLDGLGRRPEVMELG